MRMHPWRRTVAAPILALAMLASACSGSDDTAGETPTDETPTDAGSTPDDMGGDPVATAGFDGTTIRLGVITPTTGTVAVIGNPLTAGNQVRVDAINAAGGIAGKYKIELVVEDSAYDAPTAVQKYTALKDDVVMFAQILGTPIVSALGSQLAADNIVAQPASLDAFWVRNDNLLPIGAPYQIQVINAMDWWINDQGNTDSVICWAGQDDPYGDAGFAGMTAAAEAFGFEIAAEVRFASSDTSPESQAPNVGRLAEAGCTLVFLTTVPSPAGGMLGAAAGGGFTPTWIGQSPTWVNALAASPLAPYLGAYYNVVSDGALWGDTSVPGMVTMLADVAAHAPDQAPDGYFTFGYSAMMAVEAVLEEAVSLGDLSHEGIAAAMKSVGTVSFDGLFGDYVYGPAADRVPPRTSRVFGINPESPETGYFTEKTTAAIESEPAKAFVFE